MRIAIQGGEASFHDIVALHHFGKEGQRLYCPTFKNLCETLASKEADFGVMAIENTIAGSILPNYVLIRDHGFKVIAEVKIRIVLNLMALPGQSVDRIFKVKSHYMALLQCSEFLDTQKHWSIEEYYDTADAAKDIAQNRLMGEAAIAPRYAAQRYGLELLAEGIETYKENYTRFLVLARKDASEVSEPNKASLSFHLADSVGSLAHVLTLLEKAKINLTKIQSLPLLGDPFKYNFYIDCEWEAPTDFWRAMEEIKNLTNDLVVLGTYKKGITIAS